MEQTLDTCNKMDNSQKHHVEQKELDTKEYIFYDYVYIQFKNRPN